MKKEYSIWISIIAIICSIVAICVSSPHKPELGFDYQGIIVGILSLLVTSLIGLQIYNYISINNKVNSIEKIAQTIVQSEIKAYGHSVKAFVLTLHSMSLYMRNISEYALDNYISAIDEGLKGTDPDGILLPLGYLENVIKDNKGHVELLPGKRHYYLSVISQLPDTERRDKLIDFLISAPEKKD